MKAMVLGLGLAAVLSVVVGLSLALTPNAGGGKVQAQGASPAAPANVRAANGDTPGQAVVRWDAVADAAYYRIGWVNMETFRAVQAEGGREWLDVFAFHDVVNRGQTVQTLSDLEPGVQYAFIATSVGHRFGNAAGWSEWTYLTTAAAEAPSCPADAGTTPDEPREGTPTPTPEPGATPAATATPAPTPTPVGRDYDTDNDGLIEITSLAQLNVIRHDLDGDGVSTHAGHAAAFPNAARGMGCRHYECAGYELDADLDFDTNGNGEADAGDAYWDDGAGWLPIGDPETQFRYNAVFDGNGHTISNLFIRWTDTSHIGFFRATGGNAVIRNLGLTELHVAGGLDRVGGLVGDNAGAIVDSYTTGQVTAATGGGRVGGLAGYNSGRISGSYSSVPIPGSSRVGGLVGSNAGRISDSYATGAVTGGTYVGGLVGVIGSGASASNSYATGDVTGYSSVGGLVGSSGGSITGSRATGAVTGRGNYVGGLVGYSSGAIAASYATGDVTGSDSSDSVGGLVGIKYNGGSITAGYATGSVTGNDNVGGLAGYVWAGRRYEVPGTRVTASYATGSVTGSSGVGGLVGLIDQDPFYSGYHSITASYATGNVTGSSDVGGLVGSRSKWGRVNVTISYWDTQTTGQSRSYRGTGKTTRELQSPTGHTGIYAGWNADWWDFGTSRQYPALKYQGMDVAAQRR